MSKPPESASLVRVWDLPTRLFHWVLALVIVGSVISGHVGGAALAWHFRFGYTVLALLLFRLLWGFAGGHWSRFSNFLFPPSTVLRYVRGQVRASEHLDVGHNPLGSLSVLALLGFLVLQVATGLVADDEIASTGPLNRFVSNATALLATGWHKDWGQWILVALAALHVAAIAFYRVRRGKNLLRPMWHGDKHLPHGTPASADGLRQRVSAVGIVALCAVVAYWVSTLGG